MTTQVGNLVVFGAIEDKWKSLGGLGGALGAPTNNETKTFDGVGRYQNFQNGSVISWHPETGAHLVYGAIGARWLQIGREGFGYPINDESGCPDGVGRFNHFKAVQLPAKPTASIYWTPATGPHEIYGAIRDKWASIGWETCPLHYPVEAEHDQPGGGRAQAFQGGSMTWTPGGGAIVHVSPPAIQIRAIQDGARFVEVTGQRFTPGGQILLDYDFSTGGAPDTHQNGEVGAVGDPAGNFLQRLEVRLVGISEVGVKATDVATNRNAIGSIPL